jgi:hypothetical protein
MPIVTATPARPSATPMIFRLLIACRPRPGHHRDREHEHRRGRIEHAGETACDMQLAPADQGKRQRAL